MFTISEHPIKFLIKDEEHKDGLKIENNIR